MNLIEDSIHIAFRIGELQDSSLMATRVGAVEWTVCGTPNYFKTAGYPQTPDMLKHHKLIELIVEGHHFNWRFKNGLTLKTQNRLTFNSVSAVKKAALQDWGIIQLLSYQVRKELDNGKLEAILQDSTAPPLPIHILHGQGLRTSAKVRSFIDFASQKLRATSF